MENYLFMRFLRVVFQRVRIYLFDKKKIFFCFNFDDVLPALEKKIKKKSNKNLKSLF